MTKKSQGRRQYFLVYLTANDLSYAVDYANVLAMTTLYPGVAKIHVYIAVSTVRRIRLIDQVALSLLKDLVNACEWMDLHEVIFKSNVGRDFSSAKACLEAISKLANDQDEILFRNRSAYGPFQSNWFGQYSDLFNSKKQMGLVGNTIHQSGHPEYDYKEMKVLTHVQTYVYLSNFKILRNLIVNYPGQNETDRLDLIKAGEIGLSKKILEKGFYISCLLWPDRLFNLKDHAFHDLPQKDVKKGYLGLPFEHRKSKIKYPKKREMWNWRFLLYKTLAATYLGQTRSTLK